MRKKSASLRKKYLLLAAVAVGIIILLTAILEVTNATHLFHHSKVPAIIPARSSNSATDSNGSSSQTSPSTAANSDASAPSSDNNNQPIAAHDLVVPTGNFVSNHFPGQGGTPTTESSTCNTTPGAICYIKFTNTTTGESTQLPAQATDARGSTSWYWDTGKDAHLTSGQWKVTAVATLGSQTKSADDSLKLSIQ